MNRSLASRAPNSRSASPLTRVAAVSDDTQSLASELSTVSISDTSEQNISALEGTARRYSARPLFDGKKSLQGSSESSDSNGIRGGRLVKSRPAHQDGSQSSATETPKWRRSNADRSPTGVSQSRNDGSSESNHPTPSRPGWRERAAQSAETQQRYDLRSRHPTTKNGSETRWQGSRKPTSNFAFRDGSARKSELLMQDQNFGKGIPQARSIGSPYPQIANVEPVTFSTSAHRAASSSTKYKSIARSLKTPLHLQHPFRTLPSGTTFDISQALHSEQVTERHPSLEYFELASRPPNVYYGSDLETDPTESRKLVVLDLNGAMLVRSQRSGNATANTRRRVYPRPFLDSFLNYILAPARPEGTSKPSSSEPDVQEMRPYETFVWSSAQPVNVDSMIRFAFGKWAISASPDPQERVDCEQWISHIERAENRPGRILGVWTRDEMDLTRQQYGRKSTTYKDLNKVFNHFAHFTARHAEHSRFYRPDPDFTPSPNSTLLIDDSTIKACMQPFNHIPIPEFDLESLGRGDIVVENGKRGLEEADGDKSATEAHDDTIKEKAHILRMIFGLDASEYYTRHGSSDDPVSASSDEPPTLDGILLGVIGILSEVKDVVNLPAWIAAGGLLPDVRHTFTQDMAAGGWEYLVLADSKSSRVEDGKNDAVKSKPLEHQVPTLLPSHPDYMHWYQSPMHMLFWIRRGLVALEERGVEVQ